MINQSKANMVLFGSLLILIIVAEEVFLYTFAALLNIPIFIFSDGRLRKYLDLSMSADRSIADCENERLAVMAIIKKFW